MARSEPPDGYVIDVCATCGRHAVFPFTCGHRTDRGPWTIPLAVKATQAGRKALREAMTRAAGTALREDGQASSGTRARGDHGSGAMHYR
jgi:hypothetical protein